jgi:endonuclease/exonuclease/phosphatase family metal-dependent hydrolase
MRLVSYNIGYGIGRDGHMNLDRIADAVDGADVIALQEVERFWPRSGMVDQPRELAKRLPEYWWVFGANIDLHSPETVPGEESDRRRQFGNLLLARRPILASRNIALPRCSHLPFTMQRGAIEGIVATGEETLRVYSTHLCYLQPSTRRLQIEAIAGMHRRAADEGGTWAGVHPDKAVGWVVGDEPAVPHEAVVMGDMNFLPDSAEYQDYFSPESAKPCGLVDAWAAAGRNEEDGVTKPDHGRIDYALISPSLSERIAAAWVDQDADGSDHQPLWLELDV